MSAPIQYWWMKEITDQGTSRGFEQISFWNH